MQRNRHVDWAGEAQQADTYADVLDATGQTHVVVNHGAFLLTAEYVRSGPDLVLVGKDGMKVLLVGFFSAEVPPTLLTLNGAEVSGELASLLAGPKAAGFAQAGTSVGEPIGVVENAEGSVFVNRVDGTRVELSTGDPVFQDDVVETGEDGAVGLRFLDDTTFSIGEDARMVLDDFVYDPSANTGNAVVNVLQGSFSFVSGAVAKVGDDALLVKTPVLTIGVRGTYVTGRGGQEGEQTEVVNLPDDNGEVGSIFASNQAGGVLLNDAFEGTQTNSQFQAPSQPRIYDQNEVGQKFGNALNFLPPAPGVQGGNGQRQQRDGDDRNDDGGGPSDDSDSEDGDEEGEPEAQADGAEDGDGEEDGEGEGEPEDVGEEPDGPPEGGGPPDPSLASLSRIKVTSEDSETEEGPGAEGESFEKKNENAIKTANEGGPPPSDGDSGPADDGGGDDTLNNDDDVVEEENNNEVADNSDQNLNGGAGNDSLSGGGGNDTINGGAGNDSLSGGDGGDSIIGGAGNDSLDGGTGGDTLNGGSGNDTLNGGDGTDTGDFSGTIGAISINLATGIGIDGFRNEDSIVGVEVILGSGFDDTITGDTLGNGLFGGGGADQIDGGDGADTLEGGAGNDSLIGGGGTDSIVGGAGNDSLNGGADNDTITGGEGADSFDGGAGTDSLLGGVGNDTLNGGDGADTLVGGEGDDLFIFIGGGGEAVVNPGGGGAEPGGDAEGAGPAGNVRSAIIDDDVFLEGQFISVGVSGGGSFGTANAAPEGFHPLFRPQLGMTADQDGFDVGEAPTTGDFFLPGSPEESFTVGYQLGGNNFNFSNAEREGDVGLTQQNVANQSAGNRLQALWEGITATDGGRLEVDQVVSFTETDKFFQTTITLKNVSHSILESVRYMRSFDPDQDADVGGGNRTDNRIINQPGDGGADNLAIVSATGLQSNVPIFFLADAANARVATFGFTNRNAFEPVAFDAPQAEGFFRSADEAITITFDVGTLDPGESETVTFFTSLDQNLEASIEAITNEFEDTIIEAPGGGTDTIRSNVGVTLADNVENLELNGANNIDGVGNAEANRITGNAANNILQGLAGNDTLNGASGNDNISGGTGNDEILGGLGRDTLAGDAGNDKFLFIAANDGVAVALNQTVAAAGVAVDLINDFQTGIDELVFDGNNGDFSVDRLQIIGASYDGTNSGFGAGETFVFDGTHLIHDADVNQAGYTVIAEVRGNTVAAGDIRLIEPVEA